MLGNPIERVIVAGGVVTLSVGSVIILPVRTIAQPVAAVFVSQAVVQIVIRAIAVAIAIGEFLGMAISLANAFVVNRAQVLGQVAAAEGTAVGVGDARVPRLGALIAKMGVFSAIVAVHHREHVFLILLHLGNV